MTSTDEVRRSCHMLMADDPITSNLDEFYKENASTKNGIRSVGISSIAIDKLASNIAKQIEKEKTTKVIEWDEEGCHYSAKQYQRSGIGWEQKDHIEKQKVERILLYILLSSEYVAEYYVDQTE